MKLIVLIICGLLIISFLIDYIISVFFGHADFLLLREIISLLFSLDVQETCRLCLKFSNLSCLNRGILAIFMIQVNSNSHRSTSLRIIFATALKTGCLVIRMYLAGNAFPISFLLSCQARRHIY